MCAAVKPDIDRKTAVCSFIRKQYRCCLLGLRYCNRDIVRDLHCRRDITATQSSRFVCQLVQRLQQQFRDAAGWTADTGPGQEVKYF